MDSDSNVPTALTRQELLVRLPLLLNSSLSIQHIMRIAVTNLSAAIGAEAVTVFLRSGQSNEVEFWALQGEAREKLEGTKIPLGKGVVGWVMQNNRPAIVNNPAEDPRFYSRIDTETSFQTKHLLCVPLTVHGNEILGALEAVNAFHAAGFTDEDREFLEQSSHHVSLAIQNALLVDQLREEVGKLEKLNRRKSEMITVLAHEIRTPLTIIRGGAEILAAGGGAEQAEMAEAVFRGVSRLSKLAAQIGNAAAISDNALTLTEEPFSLLDCFELLEAHFRPIVAERALTLRRETQPPLRPAAGDRALITLVLKNLVANAIRFTPDGGTIVLAASEAHGFIECSVTDTGIGIEPDEIPLLTEKFYEVESSLNHSSGEYGFKTAGLGLGLSAVRTILDAHGSKLAIQSEPGKGSRFSFALRAIEEKEKE